MKIDIRIEEASVNQIDYANEPTFSPGYGFTVCKGDGHIGLDICDSSKYIAVRGEDVENLIKALQKAIELGWTK